MATLERGNSGLRGGKRRMAKFQRWCWGSLRCPWGRGRMRDCVRAFHSSHVSDGFDDTSNHTDDRGVRLV